MSHSLAVIVQCRLSSSRLPEKALLPINDMPILEYALRAMRKVPANSYWLATDSSSEERLLPVAMRCGFTLFAGPLDDVLERFCFVIEKSGADIVLRATADNPFLFYEAAARSAEEFIARRKTRGLDYFTFSGLPHGSGVEVFDARSLLRARSLTQRAYDHEHVGPALYCHPEHFVSQFEPAPAQWHNPLLRTTVDTADDYARAVRLEAVLRENGCAMPFSAADIQRHALRDDVRYPVLLVPSTAKGHGTGHVRRCLALAEQTGADIFVPEDAALAEAQPLVNERVGSGRIKLRQIVRELPLAGYSLVVSDAFALSSGLARSLHEIAPVCAIDEGSRNTQYFSYMLDIIPGIARKRFVNAECPSFIPLPANRKPLGAAPSTEADIRAVLVAIGGEDPAALSARYAELFTARGKNVTVVDSAHPVKNLREELHEYDLVVTHYGFTAFEAASAGCAVLLVPTSPLHKALARKYGFATEYPAADGDISALFPSRFISLLNESGRSADFARTVLSLAKAKRCVCPVCADSAPPEPDTVVARTRNKTYRRCRRCGILYLSFICNTERTQYDRAYFFDDYKKQYGKTYEEDFASIKAQCLRRMGIVRAMLGGRFSEGKSAVLDIGCALGAGLSASRDVGFAAYGTDIAGTAVEYVQKELGLPAAQAAFPQFDAEESFAVAQFDALTMWYVIEHFERLDPVLRKVAALLRDGGVFAFSTPSASGISARCAARAFFEQSPGDHFSLWEPRHADSILRRYGLRVEKIVPTGIHPERFPRCKGLPRESLRFRLLERACRLLRLGDTCEIYCRKLGS